MGLPMSGGQRLPRSAVNVRHCRHIGRKVGDLEFDAAERTRTSTGLRPRRPERRVYTNFTTAACGSKGSGSGPRFGADVTELIQLGAVLRRRYVIQAR